MGTKRTAHEHKSRRRTRRNRVPHNAREEEAQRRALSAIALMREDKSFPLRKAAERAHTDPATVLQYAGSALQQNAKKGPYRVQAYDHIARRLWFLDSSGKEITVTVRDSRTASKIGEYKNAIGQFLNDHDESALAPFEGKSFRASGVKYKFVTDPAILTRIGEADALPGEGLYRSIHGGAL